MFRKVISTFIAVLFLTCQINNPQVAKGYTGTEPKVQTDFAAADLNTSEPLHTKEIIVKYKDSPGIDNNELDIDKIQVESNPELQSVMEKYKRKSNVEFVQPNYVYKASVLNDTYSGYQWGLSSVQAPAAWNLDPSMGEGVKIAILDTGIDIDHEDLSSNIIGGFNALGGTSYDDDNGHGTHVAGIIAAVPENGKGIAGIAGHASLLAVKVLNKDGSGTSESIYKGIKWAVDNGAEILNLSLGSDQPDPLIKTALDYAYEKGCVIVAAAGNEYSSSVSYPAAYDEVIAVSALNEANGLADFSNIGPEIDVAAPGVNIVSTLPNHNTTIGYNNYGIMSGTSMAAPFVTGLAALVKAKNPGLSPAEIRQIIISSAQDLGPDGYDSLYGFGLINSPKAIGGEKGRVYQKYSGDTLEDNNGFISASELTYSKTAGGNIYPMCDIDWFKLTVPAGREGTIEFNYSQLSSSEIYVFNDVPDSNSLIYSSQGVGSYNIIKSEKEVTYYICILDGNGNSSLENYSLKYNEKALPPTIEIKGVKEGGIYNQSITPEIVVNDGVFEAKLNGNPYVPGTQIESEGNYLLEVHAEGSQGDISGQAVNFTIDKTPPVISIGGVKESGLYKTSVTPVINTNEGDLSILLNGSTYTPGTPIIQDGSYNLSVEAVDRAGNKSSQNLSFKIDTLGPKLAPRTTWYSYRITSQVPVKFYSTEPGRAGIRIYDSRSRLIRDIPNTLNMLSGENTYYWDRRDSRGVRLSSGTYFASIYGFDKNGNPSNTIKSTIIFDCTSPSLMTYISSSSFRLYSGTRFRIKLGETSYLSAGIYDSRGRLIKQLVYNANKGPGYSYFSWDGKNSSGQFTPRGYCYLKVYARDLAGNNTFKSYRLRIR